MENTSNLLGRALQNSAAPVQALCARARRLTRLCAVINHLALICAPIEWTQSGDAIQLGARIALAQVKTRN